MNNAAKPPWLREAPIHPPHPSLSFATLRAANVERLPQFRNRQGERAHAKADGSDWTLSDWMTAIVGELGEAANVIKKIRRGDFPPTEMESVWRHVGHELADVVIYTDILAFRCGLDLGASVMEKFNMVSERVNCGLRISEQGWYDKTPPQEIVPKERGALVIGPKTWAELRTMTVKRHYRFVVLLARITELELFNCQQMDIFTCPEHADYTDAMRDIVNEAIARGALLQREATDVD